MWKLKCIIDIGNGYVNWLLLLKEWDGDISLLWREMIKTSGFKKWRILDGSAFIQVIHAVLENLSKKIDSDIDEVIVGLSHPDMRIKRINTNKRMLQMNIQNEDVDWLLRSISDTSWEINYEVLKIIPVSWIIDNELKVKDPIWMQGRNLELIADVFMIPSNFYHELDKIFDEIGIDVVDYIPNILWAEEAILDVETKDLGCLLVDIGTNQSSYVIYEDGAPLYYWVIPLWGEDVTKDISIGLQQDYKEAEQIKKEKGMILTNEETNEDEQLDTRFLSEIIGARYEDIFEAIEEKMEELGVDGKLPWWVILIWWSAKLKNIEELAKQFFRLSCKIWNISNNKLWELGNNPQFINVIGCYNWEEKYWDSTRGWFGLNFELGIFRKIWDFFKKIF